MSQNKLKITLIRSPIRQKKNHQQCVRGLGLRRLRSSVIVENTLCNKGMIDKISYLLLVEEV